MTKWWSLRWQMVVVAPVFMVFLTIPASSQPQTKVLIQACSTVNATNLPNFFSNLNDTFRDVRRQLSNNNTYFATSNMASGSDPVYVMGQCRKYMSTSDCISCFDFAASSIQLRCAALNGGRAVLDGCFLRYERQNTSFFDQTTLPGNLGYLGLCSNRTSYGQSTFKTVVDGLVSNLSMATPKIKGFYAAVTAPVNDTNTTTLYAIAQCVETITPDGCRSCLQDAYTNIRSCAYAVIDGRAFDSGCFMRYSATEFFRRNQTTDIASFLLDDAPARRSGTGTSKSQWVIIALALFVGGVTIVSVTILCIKVKFRRRKKAKDNANVETFIKKHEFLAPKRYSYSEIKKMTKSFETKLGQGGFGSVYKGVLSNQNIVAVKVLSEVKGNGEDFINEVASVGMTSHVNIVCLVGYCLEGHRRALIYEFMPNGSLERFIYGRSSSSSSQLGWEKLHQIAIGIARGLEYLHKGCNTRILHLDIKPHNILLDQNFCPKISDFGLSKLFPDRTSMISMSCVRGTPGYIAPELVCRSFGQVSHKADVYSYGMMVLEMVGGRKNVEVEVDHTSEIYFPHWIYKKLEFNEEQLGLHGIVSDEENQMARKMIIVGLWCIQTNPLNRPTITKVLEMLEGELLSLVIPPRPYFSSPSRSVSSPPTD